MALKCQIDLTYIRNQDQRLILRGTQRLYSVKYLFGKAFPIIIG